MFNIYKLKRAFNSFFLGTLFLITIGVAPQQFAQDPGTNTDGWPLTEPQLGSIIPLVTESGFISLSVDGLGTNNINGGTIQVDKPPGATVRAAYFAAASTGGSRRQLNDGHVSIDGTGVNWDINTPSSISSWNHWAEVTTIVKPKIDLAPAGLVNFLITEVSTSGIDGEILAVIFDDPNQTTSNTIILLFGAQNVLGDNFAIALANPIDLSDPNLVLDFSLGISFGFQVPPNNIRQVSHVDVNGTRMTSAAGGQDDADVYPAGNGALLTVGGLDDTNANPPDPFGPPLSAADNPDDELYDLIPFVTNGATSINVFTINPSFDDNIFFGALFLGATTAIVGEGILLSPLNATNPVGTQHTITARVQNDFGDPIVGRTVNFEIVNGPNVGLTGSGITDANGEATFTYTSSIAGIDEIVAKMLNTQGNLVTSNSVIKKWTTADQFPFMTIWAVNDAVSGVMQYYTLSLNNNFLNVEGNILGVSGPKDIEDLIIDEAGTFYFVNNVGTSSIYKIDFSELDQNNATPVQSVFVGSTGLPANPSGNSEEEISGLLFFNGQLYGLSKETKKLYEISKVDGSVNQVFTLSVTGDFRSDGMVYRPADETVYLLKTNTSGGESEIWKFNSFPSGDISKVRNIDESGKVEALTVHPDGYLYASDQTRLYQISVTDSYIAYLADYTVDIEGMDYFYVTESIIPPVSTRQFIEITPLPVELESFTAEAKSGKVILNWQTATEVNNYGFEIHRQANDKEWIILGFVEGHGNSNSPKVYNYTDSNPTGGNKFNYRLKQIDNDGTYEYSDIVEVEFVPTEFTLYQNYPNPFNPTTKIKYSIPQESNVTIKVFDILGKEVMTIVSEKQEAGTYNIDFDGSNLVSGIYIYQMQAGTFSQTKKMLLMK